MTKICKEIRNSADKIEIVTSINPKGCIGDMKFNTTVSALMLKTKSGWVFFPATNRITTTPITTTTVTMASTPHYIPVTPVTEKFPTASAPEEHVSPPSYSDLINQIHTPPSSELVIHHHLHTPLHKNNKIKKPPLLKKITLFPRHNVKPL